MKLEMNVWNNLDDKGKKKACLRLNGLTLYYTLLLSMVYFGLAYGLVTEGGRISTGDLTYPDDYIFIGLMVIALIILSSLPVATALEKKNVNGKFSVIGILAMVIMIPPTSGLALLFALPMQGIFRKRVYKKVQPVYNQYGPQSIERDNTVTDDDGDDDQSYKALLCLSEAIKLEQAGKYSAARSKYEEGYRLGDGRGAYYLARMYEDGIGVMKNINESLSWEKKAADQGVSLSQYYIALEYINGRHFARNVDLGMSYMKKSAEQEEYDALFYLGIKCGSSLEKEFFDLARAENYLIRAYKVGEDDEEKGHAINELGRLWIGLWGETHAQRDYQMALQLFKIGKSHYSTDAGTNYDHAVKIRPSDYPSINALLNGMAEVYLKQYDVNKFKTKDSPAPAPAVQSERVEEKPVFQGASDDTSSSKKSTSAPAPKISSAEINEYRSLRTSLLVGAIFKAVCFTAGLLILRYAMNNKEGLFILLPFVLILGIVVAGLPGLPKAFSDSYKYSDKWDRFFKVPDYKATVDFDKRTVRVKKNDDWLFIIYKTLLNLIVTAFAAPFQVIRDIYRVIVVSKKINEMQG